MISRRGKSNRTNGHNGLPVLITGGSGFIGTNLAHRLLSEGRRVVLYDNLSRPGVEENLAWLLETYGELVSLCHSDVRDFESLLQAVKGVSHVFHFAAQVAVTTSLEDPFADFDVNARGTLNLLEAIRRQTNPPSILFTSTNKVYGDLADVKLRVNKGRYEPRDHVHRKKGFAEDRALDFHSPYGCSKGAACQYVLDYARTFGLRTAVFQMSCIYGPHQFGTEDQGWVAHFLIKALNDDSITIYGDGRQVRDILYVEDLVDAFLIAQEKIEAIAGEAFNIGGGPENTVSLLELLDLIGNLHEQRPQISFSSWRPADQQYYVSDTRKFAAATGWYPRVGVRQGLESLYNWLKEFRTGELLAASAGSMAARNSAAVRMPRVRGRSAPGADLVTKSESKRPNTRRSMNKAMSVIA
jgi:CDP-paratose 2-epimerase